MNPFFINHSFKDIPVASHSEIKESLTAAVAKFIRNFQWDAYFKLNPDITSEMKETSGFTSSRAPPPITRQNYGENSMDIKKFVNRIYRTVRITKFKNFTNEYQEELKQTVKRIKECKDLIIKADKTKNRYTVTSEDYKKMMCDDISKDYRRAEKGQ